MYTFWTPHQFHFGTMATRRNNPAVFRHRWGAALTCFIFVSLSLFFLMSLVITSHGLMKQSWTIVSRPETWWLITKFNMMRKKVEHRRWECQLARRKTNSPRCFHATTDTPLLTSTGTNVIQCPSLIGVRVCNKEDKPSRLVGGGWLLYLNSKQFRHKESKKITF